MTAQGGRLLQEDNQMFKKKKEKKAVDPEARIGAGKFWAWHSREMSDTAIVLLLGYISYYCTDVLFISPLVVGTLLAASKVIDAVTDVAAGYIVDRTNTKLGRGRPYDFCLFGTWITLILLFSCPSNLSSGAKIAWVVIFYILSNAVFTTFLNAGETVFRLRAFNEKQIVRMSSYGGIVMSLSGLICGIILPQLISAAGTDVAGWTRAAMTIGIPLCLIGFCRFLFVKERTDITYSKVEQEKIEFKEIVNMLTTNRHLWILLAVTLISNVVSNLGLTVYYLEWVLGDLGIQSYFVAFSALAIVALFFMPTLIRKMGVKKLLIGSSLLGAIVSVVAFIVYDNVPILIVCYIFSSMASLPGTYLVNVVLLDNANFNEYKGLHRMEGTMGSVEGFMRRCGSAFGVFIGGVALTLMKYEETVAAGTILPATFWGLRIMCYALPVVSSLLVAFLWSRYKLEDQMPEINKTLAERRAAENG